MNCFLADEVESSVAAQSFMNRTLAPITQEIAKQRDSSAEMSCIFFIDARVVQFLNTTNVSSAR